MATNYNTTSHSKYLLQCHLVFSTKYRKKILTGALSDDLKQIMYDIANEKEIVIKSMATNGIYKRHKAFLKGHYWKKTRYFQMVTLRILLVRHHQRQLRNILTHKDDCDILWLWSQFLRYPKGIEVSLRQRL